MPVDFCARPAGWWEGCFAHECTLRQPSSSFCCGIRRIGMHGTPCVVRVLGLPDLPGAEWKFC